jgi:hypothetical protein
MEPIGGAMCLVLRAGSLGSRRCEDWKSRSGAVLVVLVAVVVGAGLGSVPARANETGGPAKCVTGSNDVAAAYNAAFGSPIGYCQAGDVAQWYPLPDGRTLWILNDSYLNRPNPAGVINSESVFVRNIAVMQTGNCFEPLAGSKPGVAPGGGTKSPATPQSFFAALEQKDVSWWWAQGGVVDATPRTFEHA